MQQLDHVSRETNEKLNNYNDLLHKWQAKINLVSPSTLPDSWDRHIVDSAQIVPLIPSQAQTLYDFGSGAGFPGLVIAMMRPDMEVHLVESDSKKCAFLQTVSRETGAKVFVENERVEKVVAANPAPDVVSARALASLAELLQYSAPWIAQNPALTLIFPKGAQAAQEVAEARKNWQFDLLETPSQTDNSARILVLTNVRNSV